LLNAPAEDILSDRREALYAGLQEIAQPAGEMENGLLGHIRITLKELGRASPADLHAAEEVGLRPRHFENPERLEMGPLLEDQRIGPETDGGPAPVPDSAEVFQS